MAYTQRSTIENLFETAFDKLVEFDLRSEPMYRKFADKRPSDVTNPGSTIVLQLHRDLDRVTTPLSEVSDVTPVTVKNTKKVSVVIDEWGNAVERTQRVDLESLSQIDPAIADMLAFNQMDTLDFQVYSILVNRATGRYNGTTPADETATNGEDLTIGAAPGKLNAAAARKAVAKLRGAKVQPKDGRLFIGIMHPDVSYDLRSEAAASGANVWQQPHTYTEAGVGNIWNGEVGVYEGTKWIETPRAEKMYGDPFTITNKALTSNVATITTATAHGLDVGATVLIDCDDAVFDGTFTVTAVGSSTTFSFAKTNANVTSASATGTVRALQYKTLILGKQALVEAMTYEPKTVIGPETDHLRRFRSVGWKALGGWNIYRPEARYVITSESSIG